MVVIATATFRRFLFLIFATLFPALTSAQESYELKPCAFTKMPKGNLGVSLVVRVPKDAKVTKGRDIDYTNFSIEHQTHGNRYFVNGIWGPNATGGKPSQKLVSSSELTEQREWTFGDFQGVDVKGIAENGTYWRYFGMHGESITYEGVPPDVARYFNSLIDKVCFLDR
jgi:hypothetical protein